MVVRWPVAAAFAIFLPYLLATLIVSVMTLVEMTNSGEGEMGFLFLVFYFFLPYTIVSLVGWVVIGVPTYLIACAYFNNRFWFYLLIFGGFSGILLSIWDVYVFYKFGGTALVQMLIFFVFAAKLVPAPASELEKT